MSRLWVVAYDIEDDRVRRRVYNILKNHGESAQYSVFECWLTANQLNRLREAVQAEVDSEDSVRWYPLCVWCRDSIDWQGVGEQIDNPAFILL